MEKPLFKFLYDEKMKTCESWEYTDLFSYWFMQLAERVNALFLYDGLPLSIPQREIEFRLMNDGQAFFMKYKNNIRVFNSTFANQMTIYLDEPKEVNVWSPIYSGCVDRNAGVLARNNDYCIPSSMIVRYYADKLAHADLTYTNTLVNMRAKNVPVSQTSKMTNSIREWLNALWNGRNIPIEDGSYSSFEFKEMNTGGDSKILDIVETRKAILVEFYECFGIRQSRVKKAQMTDEEVQSGDAMLLVNVRNMLECRRLAVEELNKKYNLSVTVDFSEDLKNQFEFERGEMLDGYN